MLFIKVQIHYSHMFAWRLVRCNSSNICLSMNLCMYILMDDLLMLRVRLRQSEIRYVIFSQKGQRSFWISSGQPSALLRT